MLENRFQYLIQLFHKKLPEYEMKRKDNRIQPAQKIDILQMYIEIMGAHKRNSATDRILTVSFINLLSKLLFFHSILN